MNDAEALTGSGNNRSAGYLGGYTEDGKIIGTVPAYIVIYNFKLTPFITTKNKIFFSSLVQYLKDYSIITIHG